MPTPDEAKTERLNERAILELLRHRYPPPEWATFFHVNKGTGILGGRWIDFIGVNVWPSKGFHSIACEVKTSRSDFLKELQDPAKRGWVVPLVNECFFVAPVGVLKVDELPEGWGLIEAIANGLRLKKPAIQHGREPWPMEFMASILRQAANAKPELPAAWWTHAGEEIDEDELKELIKNRSAERVWEARDKARAEERDRYEKQDETARQIAAIVAEFVPYGLHEPEKLRRYLRNLDEKEPAIAVLLQGAWKLRRALQDFLEGDLPQDMTWAEAKALLAKMESGGDDAVRPS